MKKIVYILFVIISLDAKSQLSGVLNIPANYTSVASVVAALNQQGVSGALTINIAANYTETVPIGGYSLTATGSATSPIMFKKSGTGANPLLVAYPGGSGTPGSMNQDGVWRLIGCDYITIDGIDIMDPNTSNPSTMEFGYGLFKANAGDGCQNNTIKNCVITLNRINNAGGSGPASDGSRGIDVVNSVSGVHNSSITVSSSSGSNSYNKFYSNVIRNCNIGISLIGFADIGPFSLADKGNEIGGSSVSSGNTILDFGGGGSGNAAVGIRTQAQYDLSISFNTINNNTGAGINHPVVLRGIYLGSATSANVSVRHNTLTLHGGGTSSQVSVIENLSGSSAMSNTVSIHNNVIRDCTYSTSVSGPFYGIWNTASSENLEINGNVFVNNSTSALSGSTYLIYNNGAVPSLISLCNNTLSYAYQGPAAYSGNMYSIYNANGASTSSLTIQGNNFSNYNHWGFAGSGNIYFIYNTNDSYTTFINNNTWTKLFLFHSGAEYLINNNSSTQSLLSVNNNSILGAFHRMASAGATYLYYSTGASPASCVQTFTGNNFSNITSTVPGTGNFYGLYNSDGATNAYPKKMIANNIISNVDINSSGTFYGYYCDNLGDDGASGSSVYGNVLSDIKRSGTIYGLNISGAVSAAYAPQVYGNTIYNLSSSGTTSNLYAIYLGGGGAGLNFYKNKISEITETGTSGLAHGVYVAGATASSLSNNFIGNIQAPYSSALNAVNGIYINAGSLVNVLYNTIHLNAFSNGGNFNSNALYCSSTVSLNLRNNILVNTSSGGTGIAAAFRRSSSALANYLSFSNYNLFYAGTPGPANVILQNGSTAYQSLSAFKTAVAPREVASVSQNVAFLSTSGASPNYLRVLSNVSSAVESGALNVNGITDDYDNQVRQGNPGYSGSGTAPDLGADEYDQNLSACTGANAGTLSSIVYSLCAGQSASLISNGFTQGTGLLHQWQVGGVSGGPYSNVTGGNGFLTPEFVSASLLPGTYYFVMTTTCSNASASAVSSEATVVVNPVPSASANVTSSLVCAGQSFSLSGLASPGSSYQWIGPGGFNSTEQNPAILNASANASGIYYFTASLNNCTAPASSVLVNVSETTLSVSASAYGICLGNTTTLSLITSAVSYTWDSGSNTGSIVVSPSVSTVYSVAVTNTANCISSRTLGISVINPSISPNSTLICGNTGTAVLSVNAFTPSQVAWYSSATSTIPLGNGISFSVNISSTTTYFAEATNSVSGCQSARIPVTVSLSPNPMLNVSANPSTVCPGQTSTLTAGGATTYSWTGIGSGSTRTVAPLSSQAYTVSGKDASGCSSTATLQVDTYTTAVISVVQTATSVCPSSVVGFTASGASSYFWNTGANGPVNTVTPAVNSSYTVYGINTQSCTSTKTLAVTTKSVPVISITQSTTNVCAGELVTFTVSGAISYTWLPGGIVSTTFSANPMVTSVYNAIGASFNTCTTVAIASVTVGCTGIEENSIAGSISVFPNPSSGVINILTDFAGEKEISIYSFLGQLVFQTSTVKRSETIDLSDLVDGIYFVRIGTQGLFGNYRIITNR